MVESRSIELDQCHPKQVFSQFIKQQDNCLSILEKFRTNINNQIESLKTNSQAFFKGLQ
jgi:hypothetical protein